ncbi:MAG: toll/interleukin-1 receptor domain-containing protein [Gammaproteobacteria bacterium]|jgi:hypothetical protein|nr:toll/interleukin-1 receptor domain-containing protein [Gammaproteobacteria bacterium]
MGKRKLFVSHSSKTTDTEDFRRQVCSRLQQNDNGWYVLVDKDGDLYPTVDWERRLDEWLSECHAAVILVSDAALESWWVHKEMTILRWRWALDPHFKHLFIVLLDGLTQEVFTRKRFEILNLDRIQFLTEHGDSPETIVQEIEKILPKTVPPATSFDDLRDVIADSLRFGDPGRASALKRACDRISLEEKLGEPVRWAGPDPAPHADALSRLLLRENRCSMDMLIDMLNAINPPINADDARWLYDTVKSLWANEEAAALLPLCRVQEGHSLGAVAMNGRKLFRFSAECHVRRAHLLDSRWSLISIDVNRTDLEAIAEGIRDHFREYILEDLDETDVETDRQINEFPDPIYVLLPAKRDDGHLLDELRRKYPGIVYILSVGEQMPSRDRLPDNVVRLEPPIDLESESRQNKALNQARNLLRNLSGGKR